MGNQISKKGFITALVLMISLVGVSTGAFAIGAEDVTTATTSAGGEATVAAGFKYLLTFVVGLYVGRKILGMFGK
ncbi:hypothetical protein ACG91D_22175 [Acinetobacter guillouiae]|uniref:hypothetical protein n=1 Tax=Acinetobacter guillouiae TaxID=106649 RepID=UPI003AF418C4